MSSRGAAARAAVPCHQCPRRDQPPERREIARAEDARGQGALGAECAEARHAGAEVSRAAGRGCRRVRGARGGAGRGVGAGRRAADGARAARRGRRWRLARADRIEAELFEERRAASGGLGLALIRDGNGARSFETLLRYRGAAMAEFWRALRTLKALQAEPTGETERPRGGDPVPRRGRSSSGVLQPNEPERCPQHRLDTLIPEPGRGLHESPAIWQPNEPEPMPANPPRRLSRGPAHGRSDEPGLAGMRNEVGQADPGPHAMPEISAAAGRTARAS